MGSSGLKYDNLTYLGLHENSPVIHDTTLYLLTSIEEVGNILGVFDERLAKLNLLRKIFTQGNELDPV